MSHIDELEEVWPIGWSEDGRSPEPDSYKAEISPEDGIMVRMGVSSERKWSDRDDEYQTLWGGGYSIEGAPATISGPEFTVHATPQQAAKHLRRHIMEDVTAVIRKMASVLDAVHPDENEVYISPEER